MSNAERVFIKTCKIKGLGDIELVKGEYCQYEFPRHLHNDYSIVSLERGVHELGLKNTKDIADINSVITLNPETVHGGKSVYSSGWSHNIFFVPEKAMEAFSIENGLASNTPRVKDGSTQNPSLADFIKKTFSCLATAEGDLEKESLFISCLAEVLINCGHMEEFNVKKSINKKGLSSAFEYLRECYDEKTSLDSLAKMAGLSRYHFLRTFSEYAGITPNAYRNQLRLNNALEMMKDGASATDAAHACGFTDQAHFNKTFKSVYGMSPRQFIR